MNLIERLLEDRFESTSQGELVRRRRFGRVEKIRGEEIVRWSIEPEMGFDVVRIERQNGETMVWFDKHNDLIAALRNLAPKKEHGS